jgi:hypothetical protein
MIDIFDEFDRIFDRAAKSKPRCYVMTRGGCPTCDKYIPGDIMPPHDASCRCESGKHKHCSCDICF